MELGMQENLFQHLFFAVQLKTLEMGGMMKSKEFTSIENREWILFLVRPTIKRLVFRKMEKMSDYKWNVNVKEMKFRLFTVHLKSRFISYWPVLRRVKKKFKKKMLMR